MYKKAKVSHTAATDTHFAVIFLSFCKFNAIWAAYFIEIA